MKDYHQIGAAITLLGMIKDQMDVVEFTDKMNEQNWIVKTQLCNNANLY